MITPGSLVRVWTDVGARKPLPLLAKIVEKDGIILVIRYLSEEPDGVWRYEDETYEVEDCPESISEYLNTEREEDVGFRPIDDGFMKMESDDDYVPESEDEESEDETLTDSDEEEDEEEFENSDDQDEEEEEEDQEESLDE
jgi:hypothetical protein